MAVNKKFGGGDNNKKKNFALNEAPAEFAMSVHWRNMIATYGEERVKKFAVEILQLGVSKKKKKASKAVTGNAKFSNSYAEKNPNNPNCTCHVATIDGDYDYCSSCSALDTTRLEADLLKRIEDEKNMKRVKSEELAEAGLDGSEWK